MPVVRNTRPRSPAMRPSLLPQAWVSPLHWRSHRPGGGRPVASAHGRGPVCEWPGHRLQGGEVGPCHRPGTQLDRSSLRLGELGSGVLLLLPRQLRKCLFPFRKSSIYFLCLEPYVRDRLIGRREPKQGTSEQAPKPSVEAGGPCAGWLHSDGSLLPSSARFPPPHLWPP